MAKRNALNFGISAFKWLLLDVVLWTDQDCKRQFFDCQNSIPNKTGIFFLKCLSIPKSMPTIFLKMAQIVQFDATYNLWKRIQQMRSVAEEFIVNFLRMKNNFWLGNRFTYLSSLVHFTVRNCTLCNRIVISCFIIQNTQRIFPLLFFICIGWLFFIRLDSCLSINSEFLCIHIIIEVVKWHSTWKSYEFQVVVCDVSIRLEKCLQPETEPGYVRLHLVQHSLSLCVLYTRLVLSTKQQLYFRFLFVYYLFDTNCITLQQNDSMERCQLLNVIVAKFAHINNVKRVLKLVMSRFSSFSRVFDIINL